MLRIQEKEVWHLGRVVPARLVYDEVEERGSVRSFLLSLEEITETKQSISRTSGADSLYNREVEK